MKLHSRIRTNKRYVAQIIEFKTTGEYYIKANIFNKLNNYEGIAHFNVSGRIEPTKERYGNLIINKI